MENSYVLDAGQLFTLFFIVFGPLKLLGPFAKATREMPSSAITSLAIRAILIISPLLVVLSLVGMKLMQKWTIPIAILIITAGLIFSYVAFSMILSHKEEPSSANLNPGDLSPLGIALTMILTPYGIATLIVVLALSHDANRMLLVFATLFANLILNLLAMIFIRALMGKVFTMGLKILGSVLGVLQAALALHMIEVGLRMLIA